MFCSNCGNQMPDGVKFCPSCGNPVAANPPAPPVQPQQFIPPVNFEDDATVMAPNAPVQPEAVIPPVNFEDEATVMAPPAAPVFQQPFEQPQQPVAFEQPQQQGYYAPEQPAYPAQGYQQPVFQQMPQPAPQKSKAPVIIIAILAVIAVAAIVFGVLVATDVIDFGKDSSSVSDSDRDEEKDAEDEEETTDDETETHVEEPEASTNPVVVPTQPVTNPQPGVSAPVIGAVVNAPHVTPDNIVKKVRFELDLDGLFFDIIVDVSNPDEQIVYACDYEVGGVVCDIMYVKYGDGTWGYYACADGVYYEIPAETADPSEFEAAQMFIDICGYGVASKTNGVIEGPFTYNGTVNYDSIGSVHSYAGTFGGLESDIYVEPTTGLVVCVDDGYDAIDIVYTALGEDVTYLDFRPYTTVIEG